MGSRTNFEYICRLCGLESNDLINLLENNYNERNLIVIIKKYIRVTVNPRDALPHHVCGPCVAKLDEVVEFIDTSQVTQTKLNNQLKDSSSDNSVHLPQDKLYELIHGVKVEFEELDTQYTDDLNDEDYGPCTSKGRRSRSSKGLCGGGAGTRGLARKRLAKSKNKALSLVKNKMSEKDDKGDSKKNPSTIDSVKEVWMDKHDNKETYVVEEFEQEIDGHSFREKKGDTFKSAVRCCICKADFYLLEELTSHSLDVHQLPEPRFMCPQCPQTFAKITSMNNHQRRKHQDSLQGCPKCKKLYPAHYLWTRHMLVHTNTRPFSCDECDKKFKSKAGLYNHKKTHQPSEERYTHCCEVCGKRFTQKANLESHLRLHTGNRPFSCEFCGKSFSQRGNMEEHRRIHTGEKPFVCDMCGISYSRQGQLAMHRRKHSGEKPHKCQYCKKEFLRREVLRKHEHMHTDTRPYKCSYCEKSFRDRGKKKIHERLHTGERPFECQFCGRGFCESGNLRKHLRVHQRRPSAGEKSANALSLGNGSTVLTSEAPSYTFTFPGISNARHGTNTNTDSSLFVGPDMSFISESNSHSASHSLPLSAPASVSVPVSASSSSNSDPLITLRPLEESRVSPNLPHQEGCEKEEYRAGSSSFQTVTWALYHT
ncbi:oocyte zinc finger protein XlCOF6-like [Homarus americanus]|uniref:oocyte zinc finger protein XlCOF6-like n=1 Tax=Homarus americanus TaxID=6706 RepID=UPI001C496943|nr:oocyte zinc finger protein XlCOF6-like [Homarus americanus]